MALSRNFLENLIILLPKNKKPNEKLFGKQKGPLCSVYSLLRILHFHEYHPAHYSEKKYGKNIVNALTTFGLVREYSKSFLNEKDNTENISDEEKINRLHEELMEIEAEKWDAIDVPEFNEDEESFEYDEYSSRNEYYGFLFGFQALEKPYNISEAFTPELIKEYLLNNGPLMVGGKIAMDKEDKVLIGALETKDSSVKYHVRTININQKLDHDEHAVTVIGIKSADTSAKLYYIDPNYPHEILEVNFDDFKNLLLVANYYFPCSKENNYLKNSIRNPEEGKNRSCEHTKNALAKIEDLIFSPLEEYSSDEDKGNEETQIIKRKMLFFDSPKTKHTKKNDDPQYEFKFK